MVNFCFQSKLYQRFLEQNFARTQSKEPIKYETNTTAIMEETVVVFAKKPFGNSKSVVEYLGRYTHKIAIYNHRIKAIDDRMSHLIIKITVKMVLKNK